MFKDEYEVRCESSIMYGEVGPYVQGRATLSKWVEMTDEEDFNSIVIGYINFFSIGWWDYDLPCLMDIAEELGENSRSILNNISSHYDDMEDFRESNNLELLTRLIIIEDMQLKEEYSGIGLEELFFEDFSMFQDFSTLYLSVNGDTHQSFGLKYLDNSLDILHKDGNLI